jgi:8-oxo-dGTP pyrophosphatase MutT (NUDIX family)
MTDPDEWPGSWSGRIRATARAVFRHEDRILCIPAREPGVDRDFWFLPGGGVELDETSEQAVRREVSEELGIQLVEVRLLGVLENRFTWVGDPYHSVEQVYEVLDCRPTISELRRRDVIAGPDHEATWRPLGSFEPSGSPLYPEGVLGLLARG